MNRKKLLAVCGVVAIACGSITAVDGPTAGAYVVKQDTTGMKPSPDLTDTKKIPAVDVQIETDKKDVVKANDAFNVTLSGTASAPFPAGGADAQPGQSNIKGFTVEVTLPDGIELADRARVNINGQDLETQGFNQLPSGSYEVDLRDAMGEKGNFQVTIPVKATKDAPEGETLEFAGAAQALIEPEFKFERDTDRSHVESQMVDGRCTWVAKTQYQLHGGEYGAWLSEIFLGVTQPDTVKLGKANISISDPTGNDLAAKAALGVLDDESRKTDPETLKKRDKEFPNTRWLQTYDWGLNPNRADLNNTVGDVFLRSGSRVTIEQPVFDDNRLCTPGAEYPSDIYSSYVGGVIINPIKRATAEVEIQAPEVPTPPTETPTTTVTTTETTTATTTATTTETTTATTTADCDCAPTTVTATETATTTEKVPEPTTETTTATTTATEKATVTEKVSEPTTVTATATETATTTATEKATETVTTTVTTTPAAPVDPKDPTPTVTATSTPTAPGKTVERCFANAIASPLFYLVPVGVLAAVGGELARPYAGALNEQLARINADIQAAFQQDSPDRGRNGRTPRNDDPSSALRAQIAEANRRFQEIASDPNVQRIGTVAAVIFGLAAASAILYDWCSSEPGKAFTAIDGSSAAERFLNRNR